MTQDELLENLMIAADAVKEAEWLFETARRNGAMVDREAQKFLGGAWRVLRRASSQLLNNSLRAARGFAHDGISPVPAETAVIRCPSRDATEEGKG